MGPICTTSGVDEGNQKARLGSGIAKMARLKSDIVWYCRSGTKVRNVTTDKTGSAIDDRARQQRSPPEGWLM
jgi:hypothetical protein